MFVTTFASNEKFFDRSTLKSPMQSWVCWNCIHSTAGSSCAHC